MQGFSGVVEAARRLPRSFSASFSSRESRPTERADELCTGDHAVLTEGSLSMLFLDFL
jgi:hypothetical protein